MSTCPTLKRIESINKKTLCPGLFYNTEKPFAFGRSDTLKELGLDKISSGCNILKVDVWDEQDNTAYLQCAMESGCKIYIYFLNKNKQLNLSQIFNDDLTRDKPSDVPDDSHTVFAYELAQFMMCGYVLIERTELATHYLRYTLTKNTDFAQEDTIVLKGVLDQLFHQLTEKLGGGKRKVTILGKTRNIHYIRAKNGRLVEYVRYKGNMVALRSLKMI